MTRRLRQGSSTQTDGVEADTGGEKSTTAKGRRSPIIHHPELCADHPKRDQLARRRIDSDGFEISNGGCVDRCNDVAHVLKHTDGMVSLASHRSVAIHAGMDESTRESARFITNPSELIKRAQMVIARVHDPRRG